MAETKTTQRWQRGILVASLALNLIIIGLVAGVMLSGGPPNGAQRFDLTAGPLTRAMDDTHREAVRAALRDSGAFERADRGAMQADMRALVAALRADTFDQARFTEVMLRQRNRLQAGQDTVLAVVSAQIGNMSVQDRAAFADRLEQQLRQGPPPRRDRDAPSGG